MNYRYNNINYNKFVRSIRYYIKKSHSKGTVERPTPPFSTAHTDTRYSMNIVYEYCLTNEDSMSSLG